MTVLENVIVVALVVVADLCVAFVDLLLPFRPQELLLIIVVVVVLICACCSFSCVVVGGGDVPWLASVL